MKLVSADLTIIELFEDRILITDLKSCRNADSLSLSKDVVKYGYDLQAGMYSTGLSTHFEKPLDLIDFVFIFVEKRATIFD